EASATSTSNGVFYGVITGIARPFREAGIEIFDPLPPGAPLTVPRFDANPERLRVDSRALGGPILNVTTGAIVQNLTGPLDFGFRTYTIDVDAGPQPSVSVLQAIADKVNKDAVANSDPNPNYQAYLTEGNDIGGIDSGFLVKSSRVAVVDVTQEGKDTTFVFTGPDGNPSESLLNDRPPL